ncbi:MAG: methionyl-tRNA formyltransferase [Betaproteobacteria bacterium]|nr:methionyl-tRNA formyltransferase [Betaproteobacteria bacterium]
MRLVFAGTPDFAERALSALIAAGHEIVLVLTQPDRPAGRGLRLAACPVKQRALAAGIEVFQPATLRDASTQERVRGTDAAALVVAAYGLLLPQEVLSVAPRGAINIHASLLPRWRGAAPIQRALLAGDTRTGITIMQMERGLDTGPMLLQRELPILPEDDTGSLHERLAQLGARMIVEVLSANALAPVPQPEQGVTYASKVTRADALLDWNGDAQHLERVVRAMRPAPGAQTTHGGEMLKVWRADCVDGAGSPGTVLAADTSGITIACGTGALRLQEVQRAGGRRLSAGEFLRGARIAPGALL